MFILPNAFENVIKKKIFRKTLYRYFLTLQKVNSNFKYYDLERLKCSVAKVRMCCQNAAPHLSRPYVFTPLIRAIDKIQNLGVQHIMTVHHGFKHVVVYT